MQSQVNNEVEPITSTQSEPEVEREVQEDGDRALPKAQAVASMFMVFLALMFILGGSKVKNPIIGLISCSTGLVLLGTSMRRSLNLGVTPNDVVEGLTELLVDDVVDTFTFTANEGHRLTASVDKVIISKLPDRVKAMIPPEIANQNWFEDEGFWLDSKYIAGAKGSGKSYMLLYEVYMTLKARPNARLHIIDPHLGEDSDWFGGSRELIDRYCLKLSRKDKDVGRVCQLIDEVYAEFDDRVDSGDKTRPFMKLIVDEWEAAMKILGDVPCTNCGDRIKSYADKLIDLDERIQDEGRKFQVEFTNGLHTFKKGRSGQDSDTVIQKHWLVCGDALSQPNIKLPSNIPVDELEADRVRIEKQFVPSHFAKTGIIRANTTPRTQGFMKAIGIPYFYPSELEFEFTIEPEIDEIQIWLDANGAEVKRLVSEGGTLRKISEQLKIRRSNENPEYQALKKCIDSIQQKVEVAA